MLVLEFVSDFTDQELAPPVLDVQCGGLVVRLLLRFEVRELVGQLEHLLVGVHVAVLLVLDALLGENARH